MKKEGELRMSGKCKNLKNLIGHRYNIEVKGRINKGGNGVVYDAAIEPKDVSCDVVVKIFMPSSYSEERYNRFKSEIIDIRKIGMCNIEGVMPIFDWNTPTYEEVCKKNKLCLVFNAQGKRIQNKKW